MAQKERAIHILPGGFLNKVHDSGGTRPLKFNVGKFDSPRFTNILFLLVVIGPAGLDVDIFRYAQENHMYRSI